MMKRYLPLCLAMILAGSAFAQKKKDGPIPKDSITNKYAYHYVSDSIPDADKAELADRLDKWIAQNYNEDDKNTSIEKDDDTYMIHGRDQMQGKSRRFVEYDLTVDLKDNKYRYKMTDMQYIVSGRYALEDKRANLKKRDLEEIDSMLRKIQSSLKTHMKTGDDW